MKYTYYPGCSDEATGAAYGISTRAICEPLDIELIELEDWNCCGTTPYFSIDELGACCCTSRNLALAEKNNLDMITACNACYVSLKKTNLLLDENGDLKSKIDQALAVANLKYKGTVNVRHLLEVIVNDVGYEAIKSKVKKNLEGLKIACYYGCQLTRPKMGFDDPENPQSLDRLVESLGGIAVPFEMKSRCCGASLICPEEDLAVGLINKILKNAQDNGAQCIVTACPLCQLNLDAYQGKASKKYHANYNIPVLFFTQLLGIALGISSKALAFKKNVVSSKKVLQPYI